MLSNLVVIVHDKAFKCYKMFRNLPYILMFICQKANCTIREEIQNRMNIWTDYYASSYILAFTYTREGLKRVHWEWGKQTYLLLFQITKGIYMCVWNREMGKGKDRKGGDGEKEKMCSFEEGWISQIWMGSHPESWSSFYFLVEFPPKPVTRVIIQRETWLVFV